MSDWIQAAQNMAGILVARIRVESPDTADERDWSALRHELWPAASVQEHRREITQLSNDHARLAAFLCRSDSGSAIGFAETERIVFYRKQL